MSEERKNKLTIQEYQKQAKRTCPDLGNKEKNYLHMELGILTEVGEILDIFKKNLAYKKPIDIVNLGEEIADVAWYLVNRITFKRNIVSFDEFVLQYKINDLNECLDKLMFIDLFESDNLNLFTLSKIAEFFNLDFEELLYKNIEKLKVRFPDKFTEEAALNRNLEAERNVLEDVKKHFLWKKKIGDIHIASINTTFCGLPMLGNNYANQETDIVNCTKCLDKN